MSSSERMETTSPMYVMITREVSTPAGGGAGLRSCTSVDYTNGTVVYTQRWNISVQCLQTGLQNVPLVVCIDRSSLPLCSPLQYSQHQTTLQTLLRVRQDSVGFGSYMYCNMGITLVIWDASQQQKWLCDPFHGNFCCTDTNNLYIQMANQTYNSTIHCWSNSGI